MTDVTYDGRTVSVTNDGFFTNPGQWTEDLAPLIASAEGVGPLTDRHWQIIRLMRSEYESRGTGLAVRALGKASGVPIKELYQLFPKGPAKVAAKIAGIPKPRGCI
jgi:TusE/DsrC/DsvC family sulfur relay protein